MIHFTVATVFVLTLSLLGCDDDIHTGSCEFHGESRKESLIVIARDGDVNNGTFHLTSFQCGINPHATTRSRDHSQRHTLSELPSESRANIDLIFAAEGPRKAGTCRAVAKALKVEASGGAYSALFDHVPATIDGLVERLCQLVASTDVKHRKVAINGEYARKPEQTTTSEQTAPMQTTPMQTGSTPATYMQPALVQAAPTPVSPMQAAPVQAALMQAALPMQTRLRVIESHNMGS